MTSRQWPPTSEQLLDDLDVVVLRLELNDRRAYELTDALGPVERLIGVSAAELLGPLSGWTDRLHPRDHPAADALFPSDPSEPTEMHCRLATSAGGWIDAQHLIRRSGDGSLHWQLWPAPALRADDATEISQELELVEKRYQAVFEASLDPLLLLDERGRLIEVSHRVVDLLGWPPGDVLGHHFSEYIRDEDADEMLELWKRVIDGEALRAQVDLTHRDGADIPTEISAASVQLYGHAHVVVVLRDLRETMEMRTALEKVEQRLARAEKLELVGRLAGGIGHDIQNMLAVISGSVRFLGDQLAGTAAAEDIEAISTATTTAARLSRQLLDLGTPSSDTPRVHLGTLLESLEPLFGRLFPATVEFDVDVASDLPEIDMRSIELEQLLVNLLINARDAVGTSGRIELRATASESPDYGVELEITDNGIGMSPSVRERAFEPLYTTKGERGTGLGLSTVARIIDKIGGTRHVEAHPGEGTTFRFELPAAREIDEVAECGPSTFEFDEPLRILVVDDIPEALRYAERVIKTRDWEVITAESADAAMEHISADTDIDVIVTDYHMSGGSGVELLERVHEVTPNLPVVFVTADQFFEPPDACAGLLFKPFAPSELLEAIATAVEA